MSATEVSRSVDVRSTLVEPHTSAVSWGAIFAGAAGAAVLSLVLLILGAGLGLSAVSPWSRGASAGSIGISSIVWITLTQLAAAVIGGYLAGRLRSKWAGAHVDEVFFRDTAHGFLAWAVATLGTAALLGSAIGAIASGAADAGAAVAGAASSVAAVGAASAGGGNKSASSPSGADDFPYFVDSMFRPAVVGQNSSVPQSSSAPATGAATGAQNADATQTAEATRIFANGLKQGALAPNDADYLTQLVASRTGLSPAEARARVDNSFSRLQESVKQAETAVKKAADEARKASAYTALWLVVSLLVGAFVASWAATLGGRLRDA